MMRTRSHRRYASIAVACILWASLSFAQSPPEWQPIGAPAATVLALVQDPQNPQVLMAGTYFGGLHKSVNGGFTWQPGDCPFNARMISAIPLLGVSGLYTSSR